MKFNGLIYRTPLMEIPTLSFIIPYPTIYSFVRYHSYIFYLASAHYLLWAQILS